MKKLLYIASVFAAALMVGCNYLDNFDMDFEENGKPTDVKNIEYTLTAEDYKTISSNKTNTALATENGESAGLKALASNLYFTNEITAAEYAPAFIADKWYTADPGSQVLLTYNYEVAAPADFEKLEDPMTYTIAKADYQAVWGDEENFVLYFSPAYSAEKNLPTILATAISEPETGDHVVVTYNYSATEPVFGGGADEVKLPTEINDDFVGYEKYAKEFAGWQNVCVKGDAPWSARDFNSNVYVQCTANNTSGEIDSWLISQQIDLSQCENPALAFDVCLGYLKGDAALQVYYSEDYDGEDVEGATWVELTNNYAFHKPSGTYGTLSPAGIGTLTFAEGSAKKVYIAFRYTGLAPDSTTTFQIDKVQLGDVVDVVATEVYKFSFPDKSLGDWTAVNAKGEDKDWYASAYAGTPYASISAHGGAGEQEDWLISPEIEIPATTDGGTNTVSQLSFVLKYRYHNGDCLNVYLSEDFAGDVATATWTEISDYFALELNDANNDNYALAGCAALNSYAGKKIRVAFKYTGAVGGVTTTVQLTDVTVQTLAHAAAAPAVYKVQMAATESLQALYAWDGNAWKVADVALLQAGDYKTMGSTYGNLSGDYNVYLNKYLNTLYPYAATDAVETVLFKYYDGTTTDWKAARYTFNGTEWVNNAIATKTDQFRYLKEWLYDPSIELTLLGGKNPVSAPYYQTIVDHVAANYGTGYYQGSYINAEYYYGASAYQTNFDFRVSAWRGSCANGATAYGSMSDEELTALQWERLKNEALVVLLKHYWPTVAPVEGLEVTARINFVVYDGKNHNYTILYDVTGLAEFTYREDSLQEVK